MVATHGLMVIFTKDDGEKTTYGAEESIRNPAQIKHSMESLSNIKSEEKFIEKALLFHLTAQNIKVLLLIQRSMEKVL